MKEHSIAISTSLLLHVIIVALFLRVPFDQYVKPKLMVLDFSLEQGRSVEDGEKGKSRISNLESRIEKQKAERSNLDEQREKQTNEKRNRIIKQVENSQKDIGADSAVKLGTSGTVASDPTGQVAVRGETGPMGVKNDSVSGKNISVGEGSGNLPDVSGSLRVIDYGRGGSVEKDFPFIAETLNRRFKNRYPDRARRMGWEGEVLVSFIITENGIVRDLQIVKGAVHQIFNDDAMKGLIGTTFGEKLPYPLKIENRRIIYKLQ